MDGQTQHFHQLIFSPIGGHSQYGYGPSQYVQGIMMDFLTTNGSMVQTNKVNDFTLQSM